MIIHPPRRGQGSKMRKRIMLFTSKTCGPCKVFRPTMEQIADQYSALLEVEVYDVADYPLLVEEWGIRTVPSLVVNGTVKSGGMSKADTLKYLSELGVI